MSSSASALRNSSRRSPCSRTGRWAKKTDLCSRAPWHHSERCRSSKQRMSSHDGPSGPGSCQVILDRFGVDGRVAVVTGAGLGIGRGIALGLAEAGADVVLASRTEADLDEVAGRVRSLGRRALVVPTDVTVEPQCVALVDVAVEEFGRLD